MVHAVGEPRARNNLPWHNGADFTLVGRGVSGCADPSRTLMLLSCSSRSLKRFSKTWNSRRKYSRSSMGCASRRQCSARTRPPWMWIRSPGPPKGWRGVLSPFAFGLLYFPQPVPTSAPRAVRVPSHELADDALSPSYSATRPLEIPLFIPMRSPDSPARGTQDKFCDVGGPGLA